MKLDDLGWIGGVRAKIFKLSSIWEGLVSAGAE
jgi:hypothetical protein